MDVTLKALPALSRFQMTVNVFLWNWEYKSNQQRLVLIKDKCMQTIVYFRWDILNSKEAVP